MEKIIGGYMRDIKILINEDHSVEFDNDYAGLNQENLQGNITFSFKNFVDGQARAEVILDNDGEYEDGYILLDKVGQTYTMPIKSSLLNCKSIIMQLVIDLPGSFIITTDTHINTNKTYYQKLNDNYVVVENPNQHDLPTYYEASVPVWKSETFTLKVGFSINATSTIPEDYPSWIEILNNLIEEVDQAVEEANNLDLDMTNENGVVIAEITKKDGSVKEVEVIDTNDYYTKEEIDNKGYINKDVDNLTNYTKTSDLSEVATSGSYNDLEDTPNLSVYSLITETGAKIDLEINSSTYVLTAKLYDKNNDLLSTSTGIDLPLETMVVGASYDSETKEIILTLKNGQEVRFSVADLVSGLQTEITPSNKLASDLVDDTNQTHKFVSQSEKTQITTNATNIAGIKNGTTINSFSGVESALNTKEDKSNKVTSISSSSTDTQYPSAKCVYDSQALQDNEISDLKSENDYLNSIINQLPKVSSQGTILTLNNTINGRMNIELGTSELEQRNIPSEYTQVDYIESSGTQYIDTGIQPTNTFGIEMEMAYTEVVSSTQYGYAFGCKDETNKLNIVQNDYNFSRASFGSGANIDVTLETILQNTDKHNINWKSTQLKVDNLTRNFNSQTFSFTKNLTLFLYNNNGTMALDKKANMKLYYCKIFNNTTLVRNFIPCYRNSDNVIGLYDIVENKFYTNAGTGVFTYGAVATPSPDTPMPIHTISGNNKVVVEGKNLLPFTNQDFTLNGVRYYVSNGSLYMNGTSTSETLTSHTKFKENFSFTLHAGTYYLNRGTELTSLSVATVIKRYDNDSTLRESLGSFTLTEDTRVYLGFYVHNKTFNNILVDCQLEKGSTATNFTPYVSQEANINLVDIEYCEIGDYKDKFIRDNESNWYLKKSIKKHIFSNDDNFTIQSQTSTRTIFTKNFDDIYVGGLSSDIPSLLTTKFKPQTQGATWVAGEISKGTTGGSKTEVFIITEANKTTTDLHNIIDGEPFYYALATPTYTPITGTLAEQLENIYQYLLSYKGQTNISQVPNDLPFNISASALLDLNTLVGE